MKNQDCCDRFKNCVFDGVCVETKIGILVLPFVCVKSSRIACVNGGLVQHVDVRLFSMNTLCSYKSTAAFATALLQFEENAHNMCCVLIFTIKIISHSKETFNFKKTFQCGSFSQL